MNKEFKIKVSFERIFTINAESSYEAKEKAKKQLADKYFSEDKKFTEIITALFEAEEYEEPRNWHTTAEENAKDIVNNLEEEIKTAVKEYVEKNGKEILPSETANDIYDDLYQDEDLWNHANESADGYFIYNSTKATQEKMDCINDLNDYSSGDSGLWEGITDVDQILSIQATETLSDGIMNYLEEQIKAKVESFLESEYNIS